MSLLHHRHEEAERPEDAASFEVLGADGVLITGIEDLRVGGVLDCAQGESVTSYVVGYLREDAAGRPEA